MVLIYIWDAGPNYLSKSSFWEGTVLWIFFFGLSSLYLADSVASESDRAMCY